MKAELEKTVFLDKLYLVALLILCFFITLPFLQKGYFATHDGEWAVVRLSEMGRELKDGQFPPRWSDFLNHGFGYPLFSFTYPFPYYVGSILRLLGLGLLESVKAVFILSVFLSAFFMYLLGRDFLGKNYAGFVAAVFYTLLPYRFVNLYIRGSIGESVSLVFFPLLFLLAYRLMEHPDLIKVVLLCLSGAFLILAHNVMAVVFFPLFLVFVFILYFVRRGSTALKSLGYVSFALLLSLGISAYFFIPAILESKYIMLSQQKLAEVSENFLTLPQLLFTINVETLAVALGLGSYFVLAIGLAVGLFLIGGEVKKRLVFIYLLVSFFLLVFMTTSFSYPLWNYPPLSFIDFPWRLANIIGFFACLIVGIGTIDKKAFFTFSALAVLSVFQIQQFVFPARVNRPDIYYLTNDATTTSGNELMPVWVKEVPKERYENKVEVIRGEADIKNVSYNSNKISFEAEAQTDAQILINSIYFPGWNYKANGENLTIDYTNEKGLTAFNLPPGKFAIRGEFGETPIRKLADIISVASILLVSALAIFDILQDLRSVILSRAELCEESRYPIGILRLIN